MRILEWKEQVIAGLWSGFQVQGAEGGTEEDARIMVKLYNHFCDANPIALLEDCFAGDFEGHAAH